VFSKYCVYSLSVLLVPVTYVGIQGRSVVKDGSRAECDEARKIIEVLMCTVHSCHSIPYIFPTLLTHTLQCSSLLVILSCIVCEQAKFYCCILSQLSLLAFVGRYND